MLLIKCVQVNQMWAYLEDNERDFGLTFIEQVVHVNPPLRIKLLRRVPFPVYMNHSLQFCLHIRVISIQTDTAPSAWAQPGVCILGRVGFSEANWNFLWCKMKFSDRINIIHKLRNNIIFPFKVFTLSCPTLHPWWLCYASDVLLMWYAYGIWIRMSLMAEGRLFVTICNFQPSWIRFSLRLWFSGTGSVSTSASPFARVQQCLYYYHVYIKSII